MTQVGVPLLLKRGNFELLAYLSSGMEPCFDGKILVSIKEKENGGQADDGKRKSGGQEKTGVCTGQGEEGEPAGKEPRLLHTAWLQPHLTWSSAVSEEPAVSAGAL